MSAPTWGGTRLAVRIGKTDRSVPYALAREMHDRIKRSGLVRQWSIAQLMGVSHNTGPRSVGDGDLNRLSVRVSSRSYGPRNRG